MKPIHEQEWYLDAYGDVCRGAESLATHTNASPEEMRCMAAAPEMARALMTVLEWDARSRDCPEAAGRHPHEQMRAALRKAGVLP